MLFCVFHFWYQISRRLRSASVMSVFDSVYVSVCLCLCVCLCVSVRTRWSPVGHHHRVALTSTTAGSTTRHTWRHHRWAAPVTARRSAAMTTDGVRRGRRRRLMPEYDITIDHCRITSHTHVVLIEPVTKVCHELTLSLSHSTNNNYKTAFSSEADHPRLCVFPVMWQRWQAHHYTQWTIKKRDILFLTITLANLNRFL